MRALRNLFINAALWLLLAPWFIAILGAASNQLVLFVNHDRFPVALNLVKLHEMSTPDSLVPSNDGVLMIDDTHCLMTSQTHLNILADIFDFHREIASIGDLLLDFGDSISDFCHIAWFTFVILKLCSLSPNQPAASPVQTSSGQQDIPDWETVRTTPAWKVAMALAPYPVDDTGSDL